ncbi:MAG TPA: hypothetical protein VLF43_03265, partial [Candidatus Saccharimonadales bacterium]|nr:hypothetical protein [Candidatus Saccharimonadales bacterium]
MKNFLMKDFLTVAGIEMGSAALHALPKGLREKIAAVPPTKLNDPRDVLLRWRGIGPVSKLLNGAWAHAPAADRSVSSVSTSQWEPVVAMIRRRDYEAMRKYADRVTVAYHVGSWAVAGLSATKEQFLAPVDGSGAPDPEGKFMGVVVRRGPGELHVAIGSLNTRGASRQLHALPTQIGSYSVGSEVP